MADDMTPIARAVSKERKPSSIVPTGGECSAVINGRAAVRGRTGGVERWARELCARLPAVRPGAYTVVAPPAALAHAAGHAWEQAALPARAARLGAEAIVSPANTAPLVSGANVVVVHDAAVLRHPEWFSRPYAAWQRRLVPAIVRRARAVITVSEFSRAELAALTGRDADTISVVSAGVAETFHPRADGDAAARALGLAHPYVLVVATPSARKDLAALVPVARRLAEGGIELVLAGAGRSYLPGGAVPLRALGYVPEEHLPGLYAGARAVVMPSPYEGFGLPCVEAMACGTPVVAVRAGGLPEACGAGGLLVEPGNSAELADAVAAAATDEPLRERLAHAGNQRVDGLTWDVTARAVDEIVLGVREKG